MVILRSVGWLPLALLLLTGCQAASGPVQAEPPEGQQIRVISQENSESSDGLLVEADVIPVSPEDFSQAFHNRLEEAWAHYDQISPTDHVLTSQFVSWSEAVDFLGIPVENPLETQAWLIPWPISNETEPQESFLVEVQLHALSQDNIERASLYATYWTGDSTIWVQFFAGVYTESPASFMEQPLASHQQILPSGNHVLVFDLDEQDEAYVSQNAYLVDGEVLYRIYVVGESEQAEALGQTLDKLLALF